MSVEVSWRPRAAPLAPVAAAARGPVAVALARRLLDLDDEGLALLHGVSGAGLLLVLGDGDALPWVEGVVYLGRDPSAASLLLPTAREPDVPAALFERALLARFGTLAAPVAVLLDPPAVASASAARPISRATLLEVLSAEESAEC